MTIMRLKTLLYSACLILFSSGSASASVLNVTEMAYANPTTVHIQSLNPAVAEYVYAGAFATTDGMTSFESWCVDIFKNTYFGAVVNDYALNSGTTALGAPKADLLGRLATEALGLVTDSTSSGAFQLATWEIMNEVVGNPYNLLSGNFSVFGASDNSVALAQSWLMNLPGTSTYAVNVYQSPTHQNLAVFENTPVPEPAMLGLFSIGLLGVAVSRRKRSKSPKGMFS